MNGEHLLTVVQMNDSHAYLETHQEIFWQGSRAVFRPAGGYARIATLLNHIRAEQPGQVLFCDCGDTLHGTYPAVKTKGQAVIPAINALSPAAMTAHWEFAYTPTVFEQETEQLAFPMLAANVYSKSDGQRVFPAFRVVETGGLRIGLVGIASNIVDKTMPPAFSEGLQFTLGNEELPEVIAALREVDQVDLIVLISHLGFPQDVWLMEEVPGVDVCLSAHTHHRLRQPVTVGKTLIIQSGCHGSFLGRLDLTLTDGEISSFRHRLIEVEGSLPPDAEMEQLIEAQVQPFREELSQVVGVTETPLFRSTALESTMDNFLLEAMRERTGAELAFSNGWRYGAPIPTGPITLNDLYNMVPMNPPLSTVDLTGQEIRQMLEENLEHTYSRDPYRQMGGYVKRCLGPSAYIKLENPPGQRIQELFINGGYVEADQIYPAVFITAQGVPSKYGSNRQDHPEHIVEVMRDFLKHRQPLRVELRGTFTLI